MARRDPRTQVYRSKSRREGETKTVGRLPGAEGSFPEVPAVPAANRTFVPCSGYLFRQVVSTVGKIARAPSTGQAACSGKSSSKQRVSCKWCRYLVGR